MHTVLVRYGEIALKGRNRPAFLRRLRRNIRASLAAHGLEGQVHTRGRRAYVSTYHPHAALEPLSRVFGVVSASPVMSVTPDMDAILAELLSQAQDAGLGASSTFRIKARRADKSFAVLSPEIERLTGSAVVDRFQATVDLSAEASLTIGIEVDCDRAMVYSRTVRGPGGLPVGIEGRVVSLLSGGIDSFVATWLMMRRGCAVIPLHVAIDPSDIAAVQEQVALLQSYSHGWQLRPEIVDYRAAIAPILEQLQSPSEQRYACLICKRAMLTLAEDVARERDAHAIVMGDSLGQVASQTLRNIAAVSSGIGLPIFRPLVGMDKDEITALAERISPVQTTPRSGEPCPYVAVHPATRAPLEGFLSLWTRLQRVEAPI